MNTNDLLKLKEAMKICASEAVNTDRLATTRDQYRRLSNEISEVLKFESELRK